MPLRLLEFIPSSLVIEDALFFLCTSAHDEVVHVHETHQGENHVVARAALCYLLQIGVDGRVHLGRRS